MRRLCILIGFISLTSCRTANLVGTYRSNCADIGFFVTTITLRSDSTFDYRFQGDLANNFHRGNYQVSGDILQLNFVKDSAQLSDYWINIDSTGTADSVSIDIQELLNPTPTEPLKYKIGNKKLWVINKEGDQVKRTNCYSRTRKFLFWGDRFMTTRKYYLDKTK